MSFNRNPGHDRAGTRAVLLKQRPIDDGVKNWLDHRLIGKNGKLSGAARIDEMLIVGATKEQMAKRIADARGDVSTHLRHLADDHGLPLIEAGGVWAFDRLALGIDTPPS